MVNKMLFYFWFILSVISFYSFALFTNIYDYKIYIISFFGLFLLLINLKTIFKKYNKELILILLLFIFCLICTSFNNGDLASTIVIVALPLFMILFSTISFSIKERKFIFSILLLLFINMFFKCFTAYENYYYDIYNNFNPNTIGCMMLILTMLVTILGDNLLKQARNANLKRLLLYLIQILSFVGVLLTESRASLVGLIIFIIFYHLLRSLKILKNKKHIMKLLVLVIIIGSVFPMVYVNMYRNNVNFKVPFSDKSLYSGREDIWSDVLTKLSDPLENTFTGLGSNYQKETSRLNVHNVYLGIITNFGVIAFLLYFYIIYCLLKRSGNNYFILATIGLLINSYFETIMLKTDGYFFFVILIFAGSFIFNEEVKYEKES